MPTSLSLSPLTAQRLRDSGLRVAITGASGWLGHASLDMLEQALGGRFAERVYAFGSHARALAMRSGRSMEIAPLAALRALAPAPTLLLHYAFVTKERVAGLALHEYFGLSENIAAMIGDAIPEIGVERMLFPSSGAVYGQPMRPERSIREEPDANPYGTQKLRDEQRFTAACGKQSVRLAVPRIFSLSGPFINKHDAYVLASVINAALSGAPVQLRARRRVVRSYMAVRDLLDVSIGWLLAAREPDRVVLDTGGEAVEVGELARRVLKVLGRPDLPIERPLWGSEPDDIFAGDGAEFERLAMNQGIHPAPLDAQIADTAVYLKGLNP